MNDMKTQSVSASGNHTEAQGWVDILLATYNGEKYLGELLQSLLTQTYTRWQIYVRDDGSTDQTMAILTAWQNKHPGKMILVNSDNANNQRGPCANFSRLMTKACSPYIMFCDQDDVWIPDKIQVTLQKMRAMEQSYGRDIPLLVHTDLTVVSDTLHTIATSFFHYQGLNPEKNQLNRLVLQNTVTGCTVMINRSLQNLASPVPEQAYMHDWWLGLVASCFGKIGWIARPTILYRQHASNDIGAKSYTLSVALNCLSDILRGKTGSFSMRRNYLQAKAFYNRYNYLLNSPQCRLLSAFISLDCQGFLKQRFTLLRHGFLKQGLLRNMALILFGLRSK